LSVLNPTSSHTEIQSFYSRPPSTIQQWLDGRRILPAKNPLLKGEPLKTATVELGCKQPSDFSPRIKECEKIPPSQFVVQNVFF
jgi:hypothetical protein